MTDYSWAPLRDWPDQAEQVARLNLRLWGGNPQDDLVRSSRRSDLLAFRLNTSSPISQPWVIVRHPLWRWGLDHGVLAEFETELKPGLIQSFTLAFPAVAASPSPAVP